MALLGNVTGDVRGNLRFLGQTTFTQGVSGFATGGTTYYVDSGRTASGKGDTWDSAFITISEAVAASLAASGTYDTILVKGTENTGETSDYAESVSITAAQVGLRIIGCGNGPEGVLWTVGTAEGTILTVAAKDCYVTGIRFRPNGSTSGKAIDLASTAIGFHIENCIIRSTAETALYGIYIESTQDVTINDNVFTSIATAIYGNASVKTIYRARILNNHFDDKVDDAGIYGSMRGCLIKGNSFTSDTTKAIDTYKGSAGEMNIVTGNWLGTAAYETNVACPTDFWIGNTSVDLTNTYVGAETGITFSIPNGA